MSDEKIHIIIAETSPIISAGISHTLRRLTGLNLYVTELKTPADMQECLRSAHPEILIVNPSFGGIFNPLEVRGIKPELKIVALEVGPLDKNARSLYNEVISIVDDIPSITSKINSLINIITETDTDERDSVSIREKEIIALVAKGLTNKEIAEKLYLSVHTVITHRRNIARKLEIHSATGLTIYAIVNKLVDLSEIKI